MVTNKISVQGEGIYPHNWSRQHSNMVVVIWWTQYFKLAILALGLHLQATKAQFIRGYVPIGQ